MFRHTGLIHSDGPCLRNAVALRPEEQTNDFDPDVGSVIELTRHTCHHWEEDNSYSGLTDCEFDGISADSCWCAVGA